MSSQELICAEAPQAHVYKRTTQKELVVVCACVRVLCDGGGETTTPRARKLRAHLRSDAPFGPQVPAQKAPVAAHRERVDVVFKHAQVGHRPHVLFQVGHQVPRAELPDAHVAVRAARDDVPAKEEDCEARKKEKLPTRGEKKRQLRAKRE